MRLASKDLDDDPLTGRGGVTGAFFPAFRIEGGTEGGKREDTEARGRPLWAERETAREDKYRGIP